MPRTGLRYVLLVLLFAAGPVLAADVPAKPAPEVLTTLFAELKAAKSPVDAVSTEHKIWDAWIKSGDAAVDDLVTKAQTAMAVGQLDQSIALLDAVVQKAPDYSEGWNKRATALYMVGDYNRSMADIEKVLRLEPRHFGAISGIGLIKIAKGDKAGALAAFKKVLEIYPLSAGALQNVEALEKLLQGQPT